MAKRRHREAHPAERDRPGVGRQRGVAGARWRRAVRRLPARLRVAVLGLLPGHDAGAPGAHPAHHRHRVPLQAGEPAVAGHLGLVLLRLVARHHGAARAWRSATSSGAWRSTGHGNMDISLIDLLNPYSLAVGVTAVVMLSLHGGIFLTLKVEGDLLARVHRTRAQADGRVLRAHDRPDRLDPAAGPGDRRQLPRPPVDRGLPAARPGRGPRGVALPPTAALPERLRGLRHHDRPAAGHGGRRPVPRDAAVVDRPRLRPDRHQRGVGREHAAR